MKATKQKLWWAVFETLCVHKDTIQQLFISSSKEAFCIYIMTLHPELGQYVF